MQYTAVSAKTCLSRNPVVLKLLVMVATCARSAASPGGQPSRRVLAEPFGNVFIAGEATHETLWGTVDGAWDSGERAAEAALKKIGPPKPPPPEKPSKSRKKKRRK